MAFGKGSITVAITSMASSLGLPESDFFLSSAGRFAIRSKFRLPGWAGDFSWPRQDPGSVWRHCHGVLEMRRRASVSSDRRPIIHHANFALARVHHRLNRQNQAFVEPQSAPRFAVVRQVGLVVHPCPDAVSHKLADHRESLRLDPGLHGCRNITQPVADAHFLNRTVKGLTRGSQERLDFRRDLAHRDGHRCIGEIAVELDAEVNRNNIALAEHALRRRNPVHHFLVDRGAQRARVTTISLERRAARMLRDRKSTRLNSSHGYISYAVFCLKKKKKN